MANPLQILAVMTNITALTAQFQQVLRLLPPSKWTASVDAVGQGAVTETYSAWPVGDTAHIEMTWLDKSGNAHKLTATSDYKFNKERLVLSTCEIDGVKAKSAYIAIGYRFQLFKPFILVAEFKYLDDANKQHVVRFDATPFS